MTSRRSLLSLLAAMPAVSAVEKVESVESIKAPEPGQRDTYVLTLSSYLSQAGFARLKDEWEKSFDAPAPHLIILEPGTKLQKL